MAELVIRNARLVLREGVIHGELSVDEGCISEISVGPLPKGEREIDAGNKIVIPGVVDAHAHIYDPKHPRRESFLSGSMLAAAGGVTSLFTVFPGIPEPKSIRKMIRIGKKNSIVDFALHAGNITPDALAQIPALGALGACSFGISTLLPYAQNDEGLRELMRAIKDVAGIASVHAEDAEIIEKNFERLRSEGRKDILAHAESSPNESEEKAVKRVCRLAEEVDCQLNLTHITTRQSVKFVAEAKRKRAGVTAQTCPHYLVFTKEAMLSRGPYLKVSPALRSSEDCAALWDGLARGDIDIVASDHAPRLRRGKEIGWKDIWKAQSGIPGIGTMVRLMLSEGVMKGRLALERLVDAMCTRPAQIFGLYPRKGVISVGSEADLVLIDLEKRERISAEKLSPTVGWTPYEGMEVKGVPTMTISRGEIIAEDGVAIGKRGRGKFLARTKF